MEKLKKLEEKLNYKFKNHKLLQTALTHSSYINENPKLDITHYERLEFLGDSVLGLVISEYLYLNFSEFDEGSLTKIRSKIVCEQTLAKVANSIDLGKYVFLGKGEEKTGGRYRDSILADMTEAIISAIYLDDGYESVKRVIFEKFSPYIDDCIFGRVLKDYKSALQEEMQSKGKQNVVYEIIDEQGPQHDKKFFANVICENEILGSGSGKSKKDAQQAAAKNALLKLL